MEPDEIAAIVQKIADSDLSVDEYLHTHSVPFGRAQYFRYRARLAAGGPESLRDGRSEGNHCKLTPDAKGFILGCHRTNPGLSLQEISEALKSELRLQVDRSTVSRFLSSVGEEIQWPRPQEPDRIFTSCGGFEIIGALALHLGWAQHTAEVITQERDRFRETAAFLQERVRRDRKGRNSLGQFTGDYNRREDVRLQRFASIEDKRERRNYSRMGLFQAGDFILERKCLAILALPLITLNGTTRSANGPLGNALEHFCGYNYQHHTLDKFLRELKYLGVADRLLRDQVAFWQAHWRKRQESPSGLPFLCYYVDGNTKPLWSEKRVKQNKVTMLGRVMGCLEQVFVHDAFGRPVYMETYAGKGPVGEHILGLFEKIEDALEGPGPPLPVTRVIVMDAASNGVATLRAFAEQDRYHYITSLDDNQWNPRKIREEGRPKRYYYGDATLRDCLLELEDSREKGYVVVVRAVRIDWDYGKRTVLITSLPKEAVGASLVVKAYFERWPREELQFREMKSFACLNRVAGYGKKKLPDEKVRQTQEDLQARIRALRQSLQTPLKAIADQEERLAVCIEKERRIRCNSQVVDGKRVVDNESEAILKSLSTEIAQCRHVTRKLTLAKHSMSLAKFLHNILLMPAEIELTKDNRRIKLKRNHKDPEGMALLQPALERLNDFEIEHLDGKRIEFELI